jgi:CHAT domain-containing protein
LAPTFAEAFFERGVANFVCTAWPVGDAAALKFAEVFYSNLLGLNGEAQPIYVAMREARRAIQRFGDDGWSGDYRTWGAYQHYGNPNLRFFRKER